MYFDEVIFDELIIPHIFMFGCFLLCPLKQVPLYIICQQVLVLFYFNFLFCFISSFLFGLLLFQVPTFVYFHFKLQFLFGFLSFQTSAKTSWITLLLWKWPFFFKFFNDQFVGQVFCLSFIFQLIFDVLQTNYSVCVFWTFKGLYNCLVR